MRPFFGLENRTPIQYERALHTDFPTNCTGHDVRRHPMSINKSAENGSDFTLSPTRLATALSTSREDSLLGVQPHASTQSFGVRRGSSRSLRTFEDRRNSNGIAIHVDLADQDVGWSHL